MELKRILAKDSRTAMEIAMSRYGKDVLVVSSQSVAGQVELVVALDVAPPPAPAPLAGDGQPSAFTQAFRRALGPMPEQEPEAAEEAPRMAADVLASRRVVAPAAPSAGAMPTAPAATAATAAATAAVAMAPDAASPSIVPAPASAAPVAAAAMPADPQGQRVVDLVRREIAALRKEFALGRQVQAWQDSHAWPPAVRPAIEALQEAGVPAGLRALLSEGLDDAASADEALAAMRRVMEGALADLPGVAIGRGVHAICGPSGAGKTHMVTRLARVAAMHLSPRQVAVVAFNDNRCGAWSQSRVLAAQAGVDCFRAGDAATLRLLLDELQGRAVVLVDTAGADCLAQAAQLRAVDPDIQAHLLLPADSSIGSVRLLLAREGQAAPWRSLMVGKVDESHSPWPLLQALADRRLPVSVMSATADLQAPARPLEVARLLDAAFGRLAADLDAMAGEPEPDFGRLPRVAAARDESLSPSESLA